MRRMRIIGTRGLVESHVPDREERSLNGGHANAVKVYLGTGDVDVLLPFVGKKVAGVSLETDLDELDVLGRRGELDFVDIYVWTR